MTIGPNIPQTPAVQPREGAGLAAPAAPGRFGGGRKISAGTGLSGPSGASILRSVAGGEASLHVGLSAARHALGLGEPAGVDKSVELNLTRSDDLGGLVGKAFNLPAPPFENLKI